MEVQIVTPFRVTCNITYSLLKRVPEFLPVVFHIDASKHCELSVNWSSGSRMLLQGVGERCPTPRGGGVGEGDNVEKFVECEFRENRCSSSPCTLLQAVSECIFMCTFHIRCLIWVKFYICRLIIMLFCNCEFRENRQGRRK
jgi:hypothetical protein